MTDEQRAELISALDDLVSAALNQRYVTLATAPDATLALVSRWLDEARPVWEAIETAPRDESSVLLYEARIGMSKGWWYENTRQWFGWPNQSVTPTHWMPLPEPPKVTT